MSWGRIALCALAGVVMLGLGSVDRVLWSLSQSGVPVAAQVIETRSTRSASDPTVLLFTPRLSFTDPGGQPREMSVRDGSPRYDFRRGDRVTVLWRGQSQDIAIALPRDRPLAVTVLSWALLLAGAALVLAALWFTLKRFVAYRRNRPKRGT